MFSEYGWQQDQYDLFQKKKQAERKAAVEAQSKVSSNPFTVGMNQFVWKYMDCFIPKETQKDYVLPYFVSDDPYESTETEMLKAKWLHEKGILAGDFRPAQADKSLTKLTPPQLPDIVNYVKKIIMIDWAEINFIIGTNPDGFIEVKFDANSEDCEMGLKAYMNTLIKTHEIVSQFQLRRIIKFWGYKHGKHIYFMLAPSWVKFNPAIAYAGVLQQRLEEERVAYPTDERKKDNEEPDSSMQGDDEFEMNGVMANQASSESL